MTEDKQVIKLKLEDAPEFHGTCMYFSIDEWVMTCRENIALYSKGIGQEIGDLWGKCNSYKRSDAYVKRIPCPKCKSMVLEGDLK